MTLYLLVALMAISLVVFSLFKQVLITLSLKPVSLLTFSLPVINCPLLIFTPFQLPSL